MTLIVALVLALLSTGLKDIHSKNEALFVKKAILSSVNDFLPKPVNELSDDEVEAIFSDKIEQVALKGDGSMIEGEGIVSAGYSSGVPEAIDMGKERKKPEGERLYPLFIYNGEKEKYYIASVRGSGLWDEIWANVAIASDFNTIAGISFDHKSETPGLGAEIKDNPAFGARFKGKKLFDESGTYKSVIVVKGGVKDTDHEVDGISGATITTDGVGDMMYKGLKQYMPYFKQAKN